MCGRSTLRAITVYLTSAKHCKHYTYASVEIFLAKPLRDKGLRTIFREFFDFSDISGLEELPIFTLADNRFRKSSDGKDLSVGSFPSKGRARLFGHRSTTNFLSVAHQNFGALDPNFYLTHLFGACKVSQG